MNHLEVSERVAGLVVFGKIDAGAVNVGKLAKPHNNVVLLAQNWKGDQDGLVQKISNDFGWSVIKTLQHAYEETVDGPEEINWLKELDEKAKQSDLGHRLGKLSKKLEKGESVDPGKVFTLLQSLQSDQTDFIPISEVDPEIEPWQQTYYPPIDERVGGFPKGGLVVCGAAPGSGKTSLALRLLIDAAKNDKKVGFFSLEMMLPFIVMRALQISPELDDETRENILASEEVVGIGEIRAKATRLKSQHPDLSFIAIDFADLIVEGEQTEQVMGRIYIQLSVLAKQLGIPVLLLSQLSRRYEGGIPQMTHLRYSGLAEAMAALIIMLWNPDSTWVDQGQNKDDSPLKFQWGYAYQIVAKSRYGTNMGSIGAIRVPWDGESGWGRDDHHWHELAVV